MAVRAALSALVFVVACKSGGAPPPPGESMPLPPTGEEARRNEIAGDQSVRVVDLDPPTGPADGLNAVRIRGTNFRLAGGMKVKFGRLDAEVLRNSDDEIVVQVPKGTVGEVVDVTVLFENAGEMQLRGAYTYTAPPP